MTKTNNYDKPAKITYGQFASLLLISDAFMLICTGGSMSVMTVLTLLGVFILQAAVIIPSVMILKKIKKPIVAKIVHSLLFIINCTWGGLLFIKVWKVSSYLYMPVIFPSFISEKLAISALIALSVFYVSSQGIKALGRAAVIVAGFGVLCILVTVFGTLGKMNFDYVRFGDTAEIPKILFQTLPMSGSLIGYCILSENTAEKPSAAVLGTVYFSCKAVLTAVLLFICLAVTSGIMGVTEFPVITASQLSQPLNSQRMDSFFIIIFTVLAVMSIAVAAVLSAYLLSKIFPKFPKFKSTVSICLMLLIATTMTGCAPEVHEKNYLRIITVAQQSEFTATLSFYSEDEEDDITVSGSSLDEIFRVATFKTGKVIVTGHTEMIILNGCDTKEVLTYMLNEKRLPPSCYVLEDIDFIPEHHVIEYAVKSKEIPDCRLVTVLAEKLNGR